MYRKTLKSFFISVIGLYKEGLRLRLFFAILCCVIGITAWHLFGGEILTFVFLGLGLVNLIIWIVTKSVH